MKSWVTFTVRSYILHLRVQSLMVLRILGLSPDLAESFDVQSRKSHPEVINPSFETHYARAIVSVLVLSSDARTLVMRIEASVSKNGRLSDPKNEGQMWQFQNVLPESMIDLAKSSSGSLPSNRQSLRIVADELSAGVSKLFEVKDVSIRSKS